MGFGRCVEGLVADAAEVVQPRVGGQALFAVDDHLAADFHQHLHGKIEILELVAVAGDGFPDARHVILNLDQKVVMLSKPFDDFMHFPDARVWRDRWEAAELARWMGQNLRFQPTPNA